MKLVPFFLLEGILTTIGSVSIAIFFSDYIKEVNKAALPFLGVSLLLIALVIPVFFKVKRV